MGVESCIICVDNSEWTRNGDFMPNRIQAQEDAVNVVARYKFRDNPETTVGLLTMADTSVRVPLTTDIGKLTKALHTIEPSGKISFITGIRIAHLALKHRLNKNHKMKIISFVASPIEDDTKEIERLAKRLKKEKVHIDVISFGEEKHNKDKLQLFVDTLNGKDPKDKCHLIQAVPGPLLSDIIIKSPILLGEDGAAASMAHGGGGGFEFGMDPMAADDPELAMALRVSLEEQRQRQEEEARRVQQESLEEMQTEQAAPSSESGLIQAQTTDLPYRPEFQTPGVAISTMSEEEQLAYAVQMSLAAENTESGMEVDDGVAQEGKDIAEDPQLPDDEEMQELMGNREYLESVLSSLPGVNPEEALHNLEEMRLAAQQEEEEEEGADKKEKK